MKKYILKETKESCEIVERFKGLFGNDMCKIKTDSGMIMEVEVSDLIQFLQD